MIDNPDRCVICGAYVEFDSCLKCDLKVSRAEAERLRARVEELEREYAEVAKLSHLYRNERDAARARLAMVEPVVEAAESHERKVIDDLVGQLCDCEVCRAVKRKKQTTGPLAKFIYAAQHDEEVGK